jgi:SiaC family regulatory phosphoprotein
MQKLYIPPTSITPEVNFSPKENLFVIRGTSAPEDVRALYYPVIEWTKILIDDILEGELAQFSATSPLNLQIDLDYFNSSSAKFLFDIFTELKRLPEAGIPVNVDWFFDHEDADQKEAGEDIANLVEMKFNFVQKPY